MFSSTGSSALLDKSANDSEFLELQRVTLDLFRDLATAWRQSPDYRYYACGISLELVNESRAVISIEHRGMVRVVYLGCPAASTPRHLVVQVRKRVSAFLGFEDRAYYARADGTFNKQAIRIFLLAS